MFRSHGFHFFCFFFLPLPAALAQFSLELEGALEVRSGQGEYEEYFLAASLGFGTKVEKRLATRSKGGEFLGVGGAYALARLDGQAAQDKGEVWLRFEADPRVLWEKKTSYTHASVWVFAETRLARDLILGLQEAANHFAGLGLAVKPLGGLWTFSLEQGLGQRSEALSDGTRTAYFAGYGQAVNSFGKEGELRLLSFSTAYAEEGPGLPIADNWTLRQLSSLEVPIAGALFLAVTHEVNHRNRPVAGFPRTDQALRTGLKVSL